MRNDDVYIRTKHSSPMQSPFVAVGPATSFRFKAHEHNKLHNVDQGWQAMEEEIKFLNSEEHRKLRKAHLKVLKR